MISIVQCSVRCTEQCTIQCTLQRTLWCTCTVLLALQYSTLMLYHSIRSHALPNFNVGLNNMLLCFEHMLFVKFIFEQFLIHGITIFIMIVKN